MIIRTTSQRPMEFALALLDRHVVDAGEATLHQTIRAEFPVLISIRTEPVTGIVAPLVGVAYRDTVFGEGPSYSVRLGFRMSW